MMFDGEHQRDRGDGAETAFDDDVEEHYPAVARVVRPRSGRIPFVAQLTTTECGAACLAMVLGYWGKSVPLDRVREVMGADRDGATALAILDAAQQYGLQGRGVKIDVEELERLDAGTILHWDFAHFVVLDRVRPRGVDIVDPAVGPRFVSWETLRESFTGVALLLEPGMGFEPTAAPGSSIWRYCKAVLRRAGLLPRILLTTVMVQLFSLAVPLLTGSIVDDVVPRSDHHLLAVLLVGCLSLAALQFLATLVRAQLMLHLRTVLDAQMTLGLFEHLVDLPYQFFQLRGTGDLLMRLNSNAVIREMLTSTALSTLLDGTLVLFYLVLMLVFSPELAGVALLIAATELIVFYATRRRRRELAQLSLEAQARSRNQQVQILQGIETIKALGGERRAVGSWSDFFADELNATLESGRLDAWVNATVGALRLVGPVTVLSFGCWLVLEGRLSLGQMMSLNALAVGFLTPVGALMSMATGLQVLESYISRLEDVLQTRREQDGDKVRPAPPLRGAIELRQVSFSYSPGAPEAIREVSATIRAGQHVAIVGRSGAGKSTLASLLIGLYRPRAGRICFDGIDVRELDVRTVRQQVGIVTQNTFLFGASIRENIVLGRPGISLADVVQALELAGLREVVEAMPMGYESVLADGGSSLSGGQRQRLALARSLVGKPAILVLDEATSALDTVTERIVQSALERLRCTRLVIAHRLSTIVKADLILVLDDGALVEHGTHDELWRLGGVYRTLVEAQVREAD